MRSLLISLTLLVGLIAGAEARNGSPYPNQNASMGTNLSMVISNNEFPFFNWIKLGPHWVPEIGSNTPTNETAYVYNNCLDSNGYPTTFSCGTGTFTANASASTTMNVTAISGGATGTPWLGGTISGTGVTGTPTITACPAGGCGTTGTYTLSSSQTFSTTITESPTFVGITGFVPLIAGSSVFPAPYYPGGNGSWTMFWDGSDNAGSTIFTYRGDITGFVHNACSGGTCSDTLNVTPSITGMIYRINFVPGGGNYGKNFRLVQTSQYNALTAAQKTEFNAGTTAGSTAGIFFNPDFIAQVQNFRTFRYMDWNATNANGNKSWSTRAVPNWVFWQDTSKFNQEIPLEVMIALSNRAHANMWLNMPCLADSTYLANSAQTTLNLLNGGLNVILEMCNEVWNGGASPSFSPAVQAGYNNNQTVFTTCTIGFSCALVNGIYNAILMAQAWEGVWTGKNAPRLIPVMGGQLGNPGGVSQFECNFTNATATASYGAAPGLWTGRACDYMKGIAIANYFIWAYNTGPFPAAWTADPDGGMQKIYTEAISGGLSPLNASCTTAGSGSPVAYTASSNTASCGSSGSFPATPANGQCVTITTHTSSASGATLAIDGGNAFPIQGNDGVAIALSTSTKYGFCFTNQTSAGSVTAGWQRAGIETSTGSEYLNTKALLSTHATYAAGFLGVDGLPLRLYGYEGGQNFGNPCGGTFCGSGGNPSNSPTVTAAMDLFQTSYQMYKAQMDFIVLGQSFGLFEYDNYTDSRNWASGSSYWGYTPGLYAVGNYGARLQSLYDFNRRIPCTWAGCSIP